MTEIDKRKAAIELIDKRIDELYPSKCIRDMTMCEFLQHFKDELSWEVGVLEKKEKNDLPS